MAQKGMTKKKSTKRRAAAKVASKGIEKEKGGKVYVITSSGLEKRGVHIATKAAAHQLKETLGVSRKVESDVEKLIQKLEKEGRIRPLN
jgi:hypothetical protein